MFLTAGHLIRHIMINSNEPQMLSVALADMFRTFGRVHDRSPLIHRWPRGGYLFLTGSSKPVRSDKRPPLDFSDIKYWSSLGGLGLFRQPRFKHIKRHTRFILGTANDQ